MQIAFLFVLMWYGSHFLFNQPSRFRDKLKSDLRNIDISIAVLSAWHLEDPKTVSIIDLLSFYALTGTFRHRNYKSLYIDLDTLLYTRLIQNLFINSFSLYILIN